MNYFMNFVSLFNNNQNLKSWQQLRKQLQKKLQRNQFLQKFLTKKLRKDQAKSNRLLLFTRKERKTLISLQRGSTKPQLRFKSLNTKRIQKHGKQLIRNNRNPFFITVYLAAFVAANLLVKHFGPYGLWFSSLFLIPFDFVCRCLFHESWKGFKLIRNLFLLTLAASLITILINSSALDIALASVCGFTAAQIFAGIYYQLNIRAPLIIKVNGSDLVGIVADSVIFQHVAFGGFDLKVMAGQMIIKFIGGLIWYFIIFKKYGKYFDSRRDVL